ncbi:MAG: DinB family protein [Candidatus Acidiferrum sp.]
MMRKAAWMAVVVLLAAGGARGQQAAPAEQKAPEMAPVVNPVSTVLKAQLARFEKNLVGAAEAMPTEKYGFKPTPEMSAFGHVVMHVAQSNNFLCSKISGMAAPNVKVSDADGKDKLVEALKGSFVFCSTALANVDDSKINESMMVFGKNPTSRAAAMIGLIGGWNDHYGAIAIYLRLNGVLPPSAQPKKN